VVFNNKKSVWLKTLIRGYVTINSWEGNIEGIASNRLSNRLLNLMISKGLFER
jgi:hypothetical protein